MFSGISNQDIFSRCHVPLPYYSNCVFLLLGQPFGDRFWIIFQLLLVVPANLLALDILDLPSCFYTASVFVGTSTNSTISYLVLLGHVFGYTFCPFAAIFWIFKIQLRAEDYLGSFPHQLLLFTLVPCWNVHSSSFCTEGSWQFPFIVLSGLKAPTFF